MSTTHEGFSLLISFEQLARQSAWLRSRFAPAQKPVQAVLDEWQANPLCQASSSRTRIELSIALAASEREASEALWVALLTFAAEKGAHVEFARFPLDGAVHCQVWDARKQRFVERPPDARDVKQDYAHVQKALRELVRIKAPKTAAKATTPALACPCGASLKANAARCPSCQRSFTEPLAVKSAPGDAVAVRLTREHLDERGIASEGKDFGAFALVRPRNAGEWLGARDVLTRSGFTLLEPEELERRVKFLTDVASWPRKYPLGDSSDTLGVWTYRALNPGDGTRATLETLGRAHPELLLELARGLPSSEPGWRAAAHLAGVELDALTDDEAQSAFSLPLRLVPPTGQQRHEPLVLDSRATVRALVQLAPELLSAKERAAYLRDLEREAAGNSLQVGPWLDAVHRLEGSSLAEAIQEALKQGTRANARERFPGFFALAARTLDWAVDPSALPPLYPLGDAELRQALEDLSQRGFPPALAKRLRAASKATPPYGLELIPAWSLAPLAREKPTLKCPECRASMKPKAVFDVPALGAKLGPRTLHLYECDACAAEEPTVEHVHITVGPAGRAKPPAAESFARRFLDAPDPEVVAQASPPGFVRRTYARWLEESGQTNREGLQLGGHPHGHYPEDPRIRLSCRHTPTLLQFKPRTFGMTLPAIRVATAVCLNPACERPGVAELVTA